MRATAAPGRPKGGVRSAMSAVASAAAAAMASGLSSGHPAAALWAAAAARPAEAAAEVAAARHWRAASKAAGAAAAVDMAVLVRVCVISSDIWEQMHEPEMRRSTEPHARGRRVKLGLVRASTRETLRKSITSGWQRPAVMLAQIR